MNDITAMQWNNAVGNIKHRASRAHLGKSPRVGKSMSEDILGGGGGGGMHIVSSIHFEWLNPQRRGGGGIKFPGGSECPPK